MLPSSLRLQRLIKIFKVETLLHLVERISAGVKIIYCKSAGKKCNTQDVIDHLFDRFQLVMVNRIATDRLALTYYGVNDEYNLNMDLYENIDLYPKILGKFLESEWSKSGLKYVPKLCKKTRGSSNGSRALKWFKKDFKMVKECPSNGPEMVIE